MAKRIAAVTAVICLMVSQICFIMPSQTYAADEKAGETLTIRVGYWGDVKDYREKTSFTNTEMKNMPMQLNYYANMTRVGTIMGLVGEGPTLKTILGQAKIDIGSIRTIHLRTTDAEGDTNNWFVEFPADKFINGELYYYPNLVSNWERLDDGLGIPKEGALKDARKVESIIAVKSYSTKLIHEVENLDPVKMETEDSYRFCVGQTPLKEGVETDAVSAFETAKWIYGIDVTLWGSAGDATELKLNLKDTDILVGSTKRVSAIIKGQELFEDKVDKTLKWSSSDESIATVDKDGNVTVKKEGRVTITAKTANGIEKSIVINGTDDPQSGSGSSLGAGGVGNDKANGKNIGKGTVLAKEVSVGDRVVEGAVDARPMMDEEAVELADENADPIVMAAAGCNALVLLALGMGATVRKYRKEV